MSFEVFPEKNRKAEWTVTLTDADGNAVNYATGDVVRFKVGRRDGTPALDLNSDDDTSNFTVSNGSNEVTIVLLQGDTSSLKPGPYEAEVALVDTSDSDRIKTAEQGVVHIVHTMGGAVTNPA